MQTNDRLARALALHAEHGMDVAQIAVAVVSTWQQIDLALAPVLGKRGVATLYRRAVFLSSAAHPWLAPLHETAGESIDVGALKSLVLERDAATAAAGAGALLQTFREVLESLIGAALSERLVGVAWQDLLNAIDAPGERP
jgi:hypothetical protein